jgi:hypothetical protein
VINGTTYGPGFTAFPGGGVVVPTNSLGQPTQVITVDPTAPGATTVTIPFRAIDSAGVESSNTGTAVINLTSVNISGTVFNDDNGLLGSPANTVDGLAVNGPDIDPVTAGAQILYASLVQGGTIIATVPVSGTGTYTFADVPTGSYNVVLTTNPSGSLTSSLPTAGSGWVSTGENIGAGAGSDGTPNGILPVTVSGANVTNANFGIEQPPTAGSGTQTSANPGGTNQVTVNNTTFTNTTNSTDPSPGLVTSIRITAIPTGATTIVINGTTYGPGFTAFPGGGVVVPTNSLGQPTQTITVDPTAPGATTVTIPFRAIDSAGVESSNTGTAVITLNSIFISGTVFNDVNGNTRIDNPETALPAVIQYIYLVDASGIIIDSSKVDSLTGNYTLEGSASQTYTVQLSTIEYPIGINTNTTPIVNTPPVGWARIGENGNNNTGSGDGLPNGRLSVVVAETNVGNQNFALAPIPVADDKSYLGLDPNTLRFLPTGNITYPNKMVLNDPTGTQNGDVSLIDGTMPGKVSGSDLNAGLIAGATGTEGLRTFVTDGVVYDPNNNTIELTNTVIVYKFEGVDYILVPNPTNADPSYVFWNPTSGQYEIDNFNSNNLSVWFDTEGQTGFLFNYSWINTAGVKSNDASYLVNATGPLAILPVELLYFTAENVECNVQLRWATASEKNNDHFTLSKSTNLIDWELVTKVNGQGTTSLPQQYGYMDSKPLKGISYYRLSQTDYDGTMETFPVVSMDLNACITISTKIFPVPAKDILNIEVLHPNLSKGWINVYSSTGALVRQFLFTNSLNTVDVSLLPAGTYFVNILLEGKEYTHSFVITR